MTTMYTNGQLKDIVYEIRNSKLEIERKKNVFSKKYPEFLEKYPSLFQCAIDSTFPLTFFEFMIEQKTKYFDNQDNGTSVDSGNGSGASGVLGDEHVTTLLDQGDQVVYDTLREYYITPQMNTPQINAPQATEIQDITE